MFLLFLIIVPFYVSARVFKTNNSKLLTSLFIFRQCVLSVLLRSILGFFGLAQIRFSYHVLFFVESC